MKLTSPSEKCCLNGKFLSSNLFPPVRIPDESSYIRLVADKCAPNIALNPFDHGSGPTVVVEAHHVSDPPNFAFIGICGIVSDLLWVT
ncbi:hypothetical protein RB195_007184 [Necator americanus]|uniref:ZP domain-containing protein n=1 Tax=Necator americanus TaxID=51031 RepID=A0ABR1BYX0_NECAM